jgi:hypothetical protein
MNNILSMVYDDEKLAHRIETIYKIYARSAKAILKPYASNRKLIESLQSVTGNKNRTRSLFESKEIELNQSAFSLNRTINSDI